MVLNTGSNMTDAKGPRSKGHALKCWQENIQKATKAAHSKRQRDAATIRPTTTTQSPVLHKRKKRNTHTHTVVIPTHTAHRTHTAPARTGAHAADSAELRVEPRQLLLGVRVRESLGGRMRIGRGGGRRTKCENLWQRGRRVQRGCLCQDYPLPTAHTG